MFIIIMMNTWLRATDQKYLDSLKLELKKAKTPKQKIKCLYSLSFEYGLIDPRKGINYGKECLKYAQQIHNIEDQSNAYNGMGNAYETMANYDSARWCHQQSYELAKKLNSRQYMAVTLFNVGYCYKEQGDYRNALNMYLEGYKLVENEKEYNPRIHYYLGEIYMKIGDYDQAEYHTHLGIKKCWRPYHDYVKLNFYINLGKCYAQKAKTDSAIFVLNKALVGLKKNTDQLSLCTCLNALGEVYMYRKEYAKALEYFTEENLIQKKINNNNGQCISHMNIAYCMVNQKNIDLHEAKKQLLLSERFLYAIGNNRDMQMKAYDKLAGAYEKIGDSKTALFYFKKHTYYKDSLLNKDKFHQLNELNTKYESEKKEKQIQIQKSAIEKQNTLLERNKLQTLTLAFLFAFSALFGIFFYNRYRAKQKIRLLLEIQRQEKLRENALKEKEIEERTRIAKDIHDELGSGISKIFLIAELSVQIARSNETLTENIKTISKTAKSLADNMKDLVWSLNPENSTLDNLIARINEFSSEFLEEFPIESAFDFPYHVPPLKISKEAQRNIFLTFKEALNNSVKHSFANKINIEITLNSGVLHIKISDNGKGFTSEKIKKTGNGLRNMQQRISNIGGKFEIHSSVKGTNVQIEYKLNENESNTTFM
ncbi:MAG: tetratricopeptide repeat protein [Bacteroidota bacterium]|nr:tetratricopeptide repeat protein [Bacteroidota bacterium]